MKLAAFIFFTFLTLSAFSDEKEYCHLSPMNPVSLESVELLNKMQNILGVSPLFCRDFRAPTDDQNDIELKEIVDQLTAVSDGPAIAEQLKSIQRTIRLTGMKKLWSLTSENNRIHIYLSKECEGYEFNKWPVFTNQQSLFIGDARKEEKIYSDFIKLCSNTLSNNDLGPYLSKDVLTESLVVLTKLYPQNYGVVKNYICDFFSTVPETIFKDTVYENFVLGQDKIINVDQFSELLMSKDLSSNYQLQGRTQTLMSLLTPDELQSLKNYTDKSFKSYNACLRDRSTCTETIEWGIAKIKSALTKIKNASKDSNKEIYFRGAHSLPASVLKNIKEGAESNMPIVLDNAFLSTSGKGAISKRFAGHFSNKDVDGIIFVIKSKNCVGISGISGWDEEDEFLCPPSMKFKIRKTGVKVPVDPGVGGLRPGELAHTPSKVYYLEEI